VFQRKLQDLGPNFAEFTADKLALVDKLIMQCPMYGLFVIDSFNPLRSTLNALADLSLEISTFCPTGPMLPNNLTTVGCLQDTHQGVESRYVIDSFHLFISTLNALADLCF